MENDDFFPGIIVGIVVGIILVSIFYAILPGPQDVRRDWVNWQECIQTRSGGDASMQWCDETFGNPATQQE